MKRFLTGAAAILFLSMSAPSLSVAQNPGAQILEKEQALDALFAGGATDEATRAALAPEQIAAYDRLRGHAAGDRQ